MQVTTFLSTLISKGFPVDVVYFSKLCPAGSIGGRFNSYGIIKTFFKFKDSCIGKI